MHGAPSRSNLPGSNGARGGTAGSARLEPARFGGSAVHRWLLLPACVGVALAYAALDPDAGLRAWVERRADLASAHARVDQARADLARLRAQVTDLRDGGFGVERAIREDLFLARPGETVVRLPQPDTNARFP